MGKASVEGGRSSNERAWRRLVDRSRRDRLFVGWALRQYGTARGLADDEVLKWLECRPERRDHLALCRVPDAEEDGFPSNVHRIAQFVGCNPDKLVQLLRVVGALGALREGDAAATGGGWLMAARDRKDPKGPGEKGS
jgi:hypothetical protein